MITTISHSLASCLLLATAASPRPLMEAGEAAAGDLLAIRVGHAETISQGAIEHAVILVEGGKIVAIGEDLPVERGIPTLDRPDWVVTPGLVNCYSRAGLDGSGAGSFEPQVLVSGELYPRQKLYSQLLEAGVTTLGLYPAGSGIVGQAVAVRPHGATSEDMVLADSVYLKVYLQASSSSKKALREAFEKVDKHDEKVEKAREKWEKDQEKKKKKKKKKDEDEDEKKEDEDKKEDKKEEKKDEKKEEDSDEFVPPEADPKVQPFIDLRNKELTALIRIRKAADYLHLLDVLEDEDIDWNLRVPLRNDIDVYHVADRLGEAEVRVIVDPQVTLMPNTRRERNIPAELDRAGAKVVLIPGSDSVTGHKRWLNDVGYLVAQGMDRDAALAAVTLEAANILGLGERLGSLDTGKDANLVFWSGDPFQPGTMVKAVMLEGSIVYEEDAQ